MEESIRELELNTAGLPFPLFVTLDDGALELNFLDAQQSTAGNIPAGSFRSATWKRPEGHRV